MEQLLADLAAVRVARGAAQFEVTGAWLFDVRPDGAEPLTVYGDLIAVLSLFEGPCAG